MFVNILPDIIVSDYIGLISMIKYTFIYLITLSAFHTCNPFLIPLTLFPKRQRQKVNLDCGAPGDLMHQI